MLKRLEAAIAPGLGQELAWDFRALILKRDCPLCGDPAAADFCRNCDRQLRRCVIPQNQQAWHPQTGTDRPLDLPVFAWGYYRTPQTPILKRAIAALKYENQQIVARSLGFRLGQAWRQAAPLPLPRPLPLPWFPAAPIVVPIPLHDRKLNSRGFNQAALLARYFCRATRLPYCETGLIRVRETQALFGLDRQTREREVADVFQVTDEFQRRSGRLGRSGPSRRSVLLFDDIYTTGSTVRSAAQVLQGAGFATIGVVVLARAGVSQA